MLWTGNPFFYSAVLLAFSWRFPGRLAVAFLLLVAALGFLSIWSAGALAAGPAPVGLTVDHMVDPLGIEDLTPALGWQLTAAGRGVTQSAYEVQVAESPARLAAEDDLWDSGRVDSAESVENTYEGPTPGSGQSFSWRVRVWDGAGEASAWSAPASWEMGLLSEADWSGAEWISPKAATDAAEWGDCQFEADFTIAQGAAGFVFRERDPDDLYMWQVNVEGDEAVLRPHVERDGSFHILGEVPLGTLIGADELHSRHHIEITADGSTITTSIDGTQVDERQDASLASGGIGFRSGSDGEDATYDDVAVHELGGGTLFEDDFGTDPDPAFPGARIEGGELRTVGGELDLISTTPTAPLLRKGFELEQPLAEVASARAYADGLGLYEMRLSGSKVGDRVLTPPSTSYANRLRYQTYDALPQLREGENVLGLTLAEGYGPTFSQSWNRWLGPRQAKVLLRITYRDGSTQDVVTDESWQWAEGPVTGAGIYAGESYDALQRRPGWDAPGPPEPGWGPVRSVPAPGGRMEADTTPPIEVVRSVAPVAVTEPSPGTYVFDLGENIAGWARLAVQGSAGEVVRMHYAEDLLPDGHLDPTTNSNAASIDSYVVGGAGAEVFEPEFTYHGFRYVEVTGLPAPPVAGTITGEVVHSSMSGNATFESSDPLLDRIFADNERTMLNNSMSYPTDNPVRDERTGAPMDVQAYGDAAVEDFGADRYLQAYLTEIGGGWGGAPDMDAANVPLAWDEYQQYGDRATLEEFYPGMVRSLEHYEEEAVAAPGLIWPEPSEHLNNGFGDWCPPAPEPGAREGVGGPDVGGYEACFSEVALVNTALAYRDAKFTAAAARALGEDTDATRFEGLATRIEAAFEQRFATPTGYSSGRQVTSILPLAFGMVPASRRDAVAEGLVDRITGPDAGHLDTGIFGTRFLVEALDEAGRPDLALRVLDQTTYPGFGYEIGFGSQIGLPPGSGATTDWEEWTYESGMESHDHAMWGGINSSFITRFAGIEPLGAGYSTISIAPDPPAGLEHVAATVQTVRGEVASSWHQSATGFELDVTVPPNSAAKVRVPVRAGDEVRESGVPAAQAPGVTFLESTGGASIYAVGSGTYDFVAAPPKPEEPEEPEEPTHPEEEGGHSEPEEPGDGGGGQGQSPAPGASSSTPDGPGTKTPNEGGTKDAPPRLAASAVARGGKVRVEIDCAAHCPAAGTKLTVKVLDARTSKVLARVRGRVVDGRLAFSFRDRKRLPARLRLLVTGAPGGKITITTRVRSS